MPVHLPRTGFELYLLLHRPLRKDARRMQFEDLSRPDGRGAEVGLHTSGGGRRLRGERKQNRRDGSKSADAPLPAPDVGQHYRTVRRSQGKRGRRRCESSTGDKLISEWP
jgi:hypothetical protein